jgi:hypothetical protein
MRIRVDSQAARATETLSARSAGVFLAPFVAFSIINLCVVDVPVG